MTRYRPLPFSFDAVRYTPFLQGVPGLTVIEEPREGERAVANVELHTVQGPEDAAVMEGDYLILNDNGTVFAVMEAPLFEAIYQPLPPADPLVQAVAALLLDPATPGHINAALQRALDAQTGASP